ncbi:MAG: alpha/beta hydrolase [Anaerolineaceae bacterium]|jgi:pimeloyl-ACP methyl ester carboxylesterase|nr:alpha/beta hydrolase [Anaerolineaceae bacterium]
MATEFVNFKNERIAYEVTGEGPLVVCIPSLGDVRAEYRFLTPRLVAAGYRVATMDVRGHGETSVHWDDFSVVGIGEDILALVRALDAGPAVVIGTSMGGGAAVWAATQAPELIRGLVLLDPFVDGDSNPWLVFILSLLFARPWGARMWKKYYTSLYPTQTPADFAQYTQDLYTNIKQPGRLEAVIAMLRASKRASGERLSQVRQPALVVMGSKDPDFKHPEAEARRVAQAVRGDFKLIPDAGHYPHAEMPEVTAPIILDFVNSLPG